VDLNALMIALFDELFEHVIWRRRLTIQLSPPTARRPERGSFMLRLADTQSCLPEECPSNNVDSLIANIQAHTGTHWQSFLTDNPAALVGHVGDCRRYGASAR
jgi:hypothetical protein